ncbi:rhomboid family intramembrane serine protease [Allonocardiopsis opalescens]|uniref:Membrane associated rhomboid family serine protease n=1 Tax=Allonocardiopsis opalescens TaxID=1144618 RepID=A0A2T0PZS6_9ACTN|nr:rhomboid family intramembrane serine protease [Allonocardiopsis opalescens]PRX97034.1 membrane associated rhomboid family serine protease [Allonocardiopsis opalescens]
MAGMIPMGDDFPTRRVPVVTYSLLAANVVVYLLSPGSLLAGWYGTAEERWCAYAVYIAQWGAIPQELFTGAQLDVGQLALQGCPAEPFPKFVWFSLVSAMFLHGDAMHLLSNMLFLFAFGPSVEDLFGRVRYVLAYLLTGIAGTVGFALLSPEGTTPLIGASGAVAGVLGAYLVLQPRARMIGLLFGLVPIRLPGWVVAGSFFVIEYFRMVQDYLAPEIERSAVAYSAHVFGFVAGVVAGVIGYRTRWWRVPGSVYDLRR